MSLTDWDGDVCVPKLGCSQQHHESCTTPRSVRRRHCAPNVAWKGEKREAEKDQCHPYGLPCNAAQHRYLMKRGWFCCESFGDIRIEVPI